MGDEHLTKALRLQEMYDRLSAAPAAKTLEEAVELIVYIMNAVEDEFTSIPYDAELADPRSMKDTKGRMYPPDLTAMVDVAGKPYVKKSRHRAHQTFVGTNGSIEIKAVKTGLIIFSKPGHDGKGIPDL